MFGRVRRAARLAACLAGVAACRSGASAVGTPPSGGAGPPITAADWEEVARLHAACALPAAPDSAAWTSRELPLGAGAIRLPRHFAERPGGERRLREWMAGDSARVEVWIAPEPATGLATSGPVRPEFEGECALRVGGRLAEVTRLRLLGPGAGDTAYAASVAALPRDGLAINAWVEGRTPAARDLLLAAVAGIAVRAPGR